MRSSVLLALLLAGAAGARADGQGAPVDDQFEADGSRKMKR